MIGLLIGLVFSGFLLLAWLFVVAVYLLAAFLGGVVLGLVLFLHGLITKT